MKLWSRCTSKTLEKSNEKSIKRLCEFAAKNVITKSKINKNEKSGIFIKELLTGSNAMPS